MKVRVMAGVVLEVIVILSWVGVVLVRRTENVVTPDRIVLVPYRWSVSIRLLPLTE